MFAQDREFQVKPKLEYVIFDLGRVLLDADKKAAFGQIGIKNFIKYIVTLHNPLGLFGLHDKFCDFLNEVDPPRPNHPGALSPNGKTLLPNLWCDLLSGKITCQEAHETALSLLDEYAHLISDDAERRMMESVARVSFTPKILAKILRPVKKGIKLVRTCKENGLKVVILSNMDAESWELIRDKNPKLFDEFKKKNIFISGKMKDMKPTAQIYQTVLDAINCNDPATCAFIDDQKENIEQAEKAGIHGILCERKKGWISSWPDFDDVSKKLASLTVDEVVIDQNEEETQPA